MNVTRAAFEEAVKALQRAGIEGRQPPPMRCDDAEREKTLQAVAKAYGTVALFEHQGEIRDPE